MLGTVVYGLPGDVTLFGGILVVDYQAFNIGTGVSLGYVGALSADITNSSAKFDNESTLIGQSYRVRYFSRAVHGHLRRFNRAAVFNRGLLQFQ